MKNYHGRCACGAIRYVARSEPIKPHYCHCETCRRITGAPVSAWVNFVKSGFEWLDREPSWYRSSPGMQRGFCGSCGSTLCTVEDDGYVCVSIASLDRAAEIAPRYHIYWQHALPWLSQDDALPREQREDRF
ncbi:MAG: GFA family protein [Rhodanobacteraceae bacterium]